MADFEYIKMYTCEDDYVEHDGICNELTVVITLHEYRELIEEKVKQAAEIERLTAERDKLEKRAQAYREALLAKHPEVIRNITAAVTEMLGNDPEPEDDTEAADACPLTGCGTEEAES